MSDRLSIYILTDTHYLSKKMWVEGEPINSREKGDQIAIKCTPEILRSFFKKILDDKETEYVLITGDLINNGDRISHEDFIEELKVLSAAGKKVLVTAATHDYAGLGDDENIFHPVYYRENDCEPAERVYKTELPELYYDFGHCYADSIDKESGSYSVALGNKVRLIAIYDNGNGRSHCGLFDEGFKWLEDEIKKANENGEFVFLAVHHPVLPPWPIYKGIAEFELFGGYEKLSRIMCENGVKLIFTGHTHVQGIKKYEDSEGRFFYDITTSALPSAVGRMRKVTFDNSVGKCSVESIGIETIEGLDTNGLSAKDYIYSLNFIGLVEKSFSLMDTDWETFCYNFDRVVSVPFFRKHPFISKKGIKIFLKIPMSLIGRFGKKAGGVTKEDIKYLKDIKFFDCLVKIVASVFGGNGPFPPNTPEYRALTGGAIKGIKLLKVFGVDLDKIIPGEETALETMKHFLYNNRTGDDDSIIIDMERKIK